MDSTFLKRPQIQQDLPDRQTVDNLVRVQTPTGMKADPKTLFPGPELTKTVASLQQTITQTTQLLDRIHMQVRGLVVPCAVLFDTELAKALSIPEVEKISTTGLLEYGQLTALKGTPFYSEAKNAWDEHQEGMDGSLVAELEPICESILQTFCDLAVAMSDSALYNIPWNGSLERLSDLELQTRQSLLDNMQQQLQACADGNIGSYNSLKEQADSLEATIKHRNEIAGTIQGMAQRYRDLLSDIEDATVASYRNTVNQANQASVTSLLDSSGLPIPAVKLLMYESFNRKRALLRVLKNGPGQSLTPAAKAGITRDLVRKTRIHLDMAVPAKSRLCHGTILSDLGETAALEVLDGVEAAQESYRSAMVQFLNMTNTEVEVLKKQVSLIYDKDKTRAMYKR